MISIFKPVHEEGDQAATQHQPKTDEEQAHEPGVFASLVGDVGHDLLLAGSASGHAWVKTQGCVVADVLIFAISFGGRRVEPTSVYWRCCV